MSKEKTQKEKLDELRKVVEEIRSAFADVPEEELQREIDKATAAAREQTRRELKQPKSA